MLTKKLRKGTPVANEEFGIRNGFEEEAIRLATLLPYYFLIPFLPQQYLQQRQHRQH
jgi:hypothetical protein